MFKQVSWIILLMFALSACVTQQYGGSYDNNSASAHRAKAHTELGSEYLKTRNYKIALQEYQIATQKDPNYAPAYNGLGLVYSALGQVPEADSAFTRAIKLDPKNSDTHNNYGSFLCKNGRYGESVAQFLEAVKNPLYSTPNFAYTNAGICSALNKDMTNAELYFSRALRLEPLTHIAAYELANIQFNRGDATKAKATLANAIIAYQSPKVLWLGVRIAKALDDRGAQAMYAVRLRKQHPNSIEAKKLQNGQY